MALFGRWFNMSLIKVDEWKSGDGSRTFAPCTAWVNFNGIGAPSIRDSENVSSVIDIGVGKFTINFTVNMDNTDYSAVMEGHRVAGSADTRLAEIANPLLVGSLSVECLTGDQTLFVDPNIFCAQVFGGINP